MIEPIFIRIDGCIFNIADVKSIWHDAGDDKTYCSYNSDTCDTYIKGDAREELWGLIKFAMAKRSGGVIELTADSEPTPIIIEPEPDARVVIGELFNGTPIYAQ